MDRKRVAGHPVEQLDADRIRLHRLRQDHAEAGSWQLINYWSDSWLRVVLTGCVMGLVVGLLCRAILLPP